VAQAGRVAGVGYSGTPLPAKLGIKPGATIALLNAPAGFDDLLVPLPAVSVRRRLGGRFDVIVCFLDRRRDLERRIESLRPALQPDGGLWLAWPKRSSAIATDLDENVLREVVLPTGLVDNKVCAIDATWSGLRFVWRRELRA
jgi:hypothetical protein